MTYEMKTDALEQVFEGAGGAAEIAELKAAVAGLRAKVDGFAVADGRPVLAGASEEAPERKAFVERYLRKGIEAPEVKGMTAGVPSEGGYAVPEVVDAAIGALLKDMSPIRRIANVVSIGSSNYRKLVTDGGLASGWVSEVSARDETAPPSFHEIAPPMGELYANPAASQTMLDDAMFDVEGWLAAEIAAEFARAEGAAFVRGNGISRPKGFLSYPTSAQIDRNRAFGTLQHVASGVSGNFGADAADKLIDLVHQLRAPYRQGAAWVMNSATLAKLRKLKDGDGNFLWRPSFSEGQAATLLGYPVVEAEDMPDVAADACAIAFGNFRQGYVIAEATATRILRDPFSNKPFVHFYATKRIGGAVVNSEAIKLLKFSAA